MARLALAVPLLWLTGCTIGRPLRATTSESAQGPTAVAVNGSPVLARTAPAAENDRHGPAKPGTAWVSGYWHWDGVRYVWQRGHFEPEKP